MSQITTHILDTARGRPAAGVAVALYRQRDSAWDHLATATTDDDGRAPGLLDATTVLPAGTYRMHFATGDYCRALAAPVFYPWVDVVFALDGSGAHHHIPLLLAPFGYTTYRGS